MTKIYNLFFYGDDTIVGFSAATRLDFDCFCINVHGNYWTYRFTESSDRHPVHGGWTTLFNLSPFCWWCVGHFNIHRKKSISVCSVDFVAFGLHVFVCVWCAVRQLLPLFLSISISHVASQGRVGW